MRRKTFMRQRAVKLLAIGLMLAVGSHVHAKNQIGEAETFFDTIQFYPEVEFQQLTLTVAGEDNFWQKTFSPNEIAAFSNQEANFPNGQYRYELVASPDHDHNAVSLARNDRALLMQMGRIERINTYQQSGQFVIKNGEILLIEDANAKQKKNHSDYLQKGKAK